FYAQRSTSNCAADFEGGLPSISNIFDLFFPFGSASVVADPARSNFFLVDLQFGVTTDDNAVGIYKATVTNLLNTVACPSGTEVGTGTCWTTGAAINITSLNSFLSSPHIAIDQRSTGTGAGDVYTVVTQANPNNGKTSISLTACTTGLNCSKS